MTPKPRPPGPGGEFTFRSEPPAPAVPSGIPVVNLVPIGDGSPGPPPPRLYPRRRPPLPNEGELRSLPRWARVAYAARVIRRVLPISRRPDAALAGRAVRIAEDSAAAAWYVGATDEERGTVARQAVSEASAARRAARLLVADAADPDVSAGSFRASVEAAAFAAGRVRDVAVQARETDTELALALVEVATLVDRLIAANGRDANAAIALDASGERIEAAGEAARTAARYYADVRGAAEPAAEEPVRPRDAAIAGAWAAFAAAACDRRPREPLDWLDREGETDEELGGVFDARVTWHARAALNRAAVAAARSANAPAILRGFRRDFDRLRRLARRNRWTDDTPVPPDVFGPL